METKKLCVNTNGTLTVEKTEHGFLGIVKIGKTVVKKIDASAFDADIREYEAQTLLVHLQNDSLSYKEKTLAHFDNLFDNGTRAVLGKMRASDGAAVYIPGDDGEMPIILARFGSVQELPEGLFVRRKRFDVIIHNDEAWTIVRYCNLHQHTDSSLLDGMVKIKDLVKKSEVACAITDHGNMHAFNEFYQSMKKAGKKPIIGCEVYVETPGGKPRPVLNIGTDDTDSVMFNNEKAPKSTLAGEHMILLAENKTGLHNLFALVTESSEHFYRHPHVTWEMLRSHHEGLIATSACIAGTLGRSIKEILKCDQYPTQEGSKEIKEANEDIADLYINEMLDIFGRDNFFIELQDHHFDLETKVMEKIRDYAKKYGIKTTVGIDAHYLNKKDAKIHEMWLCQQTKKKMDDPTHMRFSGDGYYVHSSEEVVALFPNDLDALDNTLDICDRCNVELDNDGYHLPSFPLPKGYQSAKAYLEALVKDGFEKLWANEFLGQARTEEEKKEYVERYEYELGVIERMGWESYFLVVSDFIAYAKDTEVKKHIDTYFPSEYFDHSKIPASILKNYEIYTGSGRGSGAGSLVCCCLGITKVDPLKYDLLFERFLSPDRVSMPDIDTDFEDSTREQVIEYCRVKYGEDHVSRIVTFGTAAAKNALKIITRVNNKSVNLGNELADAVPAEPKITLSQAEKESPDFRAMKADLEKAEIIEDAKHIEGLKTNRSIHACGVLISDKPVEEYMPQLLMKNPQGTEQMWTTELQGPECEEMGLLKMDFLGLITLGIAHETIDLIKKNHGVDVRYDDIPLDDLEVYKFLAQGNTEAVFQAESEVFTKTLVGVLADVESSVANVESLPDSEEKRRLEKKLGEKYFMRVSDCNALVRPGPNQYVEEYTKNILGDPNDIKYDDESMRGQLESTGGIMLYQEQVMLLTRQMAGFSAGQADTIRKAMGKKKRYILDEFAEYFVTGSRALNIKGCVANGISETVARKVWSDMERFAGYAFNKSHAVAYSMHTIRTAWLSKYYYAEYMTAVLNANIDKPDKIRGYIPACRQHGIQILSPSINISESGFSTDGKSIRFGLNGLKGVGSVASLIISERKERGTFASYPEFVSRMARYQRINKTVLSSLINAGCLDEFDGSSRASKLASLEKASRFASYVRSYDKDRYTLFDIIKEQDNSFNENILMNFAYDKTLPEMDKRTLLKNEDAVAGYYMSGHPMDEFDELLKNNGSVSPIFKIVENLEEAGSVNGTVAGIIKEIERRLDKNGNPWWSMTIEDKTGLMKATYFNSSNANISDLTTVLEKGQLVEIQGKVYDEGYGPEMRVDFLAPLSHFLEITQARKVELIVHGLGQLYVRTVHGAKRSELAEDFIRRLLSSNSKKSRKGATELFLSKRDELDNEVERIALGKMKLSLQQYVELQRCLGSANVVPYLKLHD